MKRSPMPPRTTGLKRSPLKSKSATTKRRTTSPRCSKQRCDRKADLAGLCIQHAEQRADTLFSLHVRARDQGCTAAAILPSTMCRGVLQAAHIVGRRRHGVRFDLDNVHALCEAHHQHIDQHESLGAKYLWAESLLGIAGWDELMRRAQAPATRRGSIETALSWLPVPEEAVA